MSDALRAALQTAGVTYLVYVRQERNAGQIEAVFHTAEAVAMNNRSWGSVLVDGGTLDDEELALMGSPANFDAALLARGAGLNRRLLATYHLDSVDEPLEMILAWGLDR